MPSARGASFLLGAGAAAVLAITLIVQAGNGVPEAAAQDATATATATAAATPAPLPECSNGTAVANPADNAGLVADCSALLRAKDTLRGAATLDWSATRAIASWEGIGLTESDPRRVNRIVLGGKSLTGSIPPGLGGLSALTSVALSLNQLTGTIPAELGNLTGLTYLNLGFNKLSGEIPATLGNLTSMHRMYLLGNDLTGPIPDLSRITGLHVLLLRGNKLSGEIPAWLGGMTNLKRLALNRNRLTGDIPHELGRLPEGRMGQAGGDGEIRLSGNALTGCVPPSLYTVPNRDFTLLPLSPCPLPAAPAGLAATAGDRNAWLSWSDPGGEGYARVTGYRYRTGPSAAWRERVCDGVVLLAGLRTIRLTNGTAFNLELQARNVYGWGPSTAVAVTPAASATPTPAPSAAPSAPSGVTATGGDRRIKLSWTKPGVVHSEHWLRHAYRLRADGGEWSAWQANDCSHEAVGGMTLTGLAAGAAYEVQLRSRNAAGWSPSSAAISATTAPAAPAGLEAVPEDGGAVLSWDDPGTGITGYRYRTGPTGTWSALEHAGADAIAAIRVRGLTNGTIYALELQARNAGGWGPAAEAAVTPSAPATP